MIDLTPIDKRIQKRLFQKMKILGREVPGESVGDLTHNQLTNRTPFIRMTSDSKNPVILMGGELITDEAEARRSRLFETSVNREMAAGYDDIYGPHTYVNPQDETEIIGQNKFKRPIPGIKSIDVQFKGGARALREGTISWTCWSFDDITRLTPFFLSHGQNVMLEWGWVYDKNSLINLPTLVDKDGIKKEAFENYEELVFEANGDFDFMYGIVKNFEYTTRDDGAFDCQTIITSVGTSILGDIPSNKQTENKSVKVDVKKLREVTSDTATDEDIITFDPGITLKYFIQKLIRYISQDRIKDPDRVNIDDNLKDNIQGPFLYERNVEGQGPGATRDKFYVRPNAWIYEQSFFNTTEQAWVRWGWFEDNVLSKFLTIVPEKKNKPFITEFQSKEDKRDDEGKKTGKLESVRIRNHKALETVNTNHYILPGKFTTFDPGTRQSTDLTEEEFANLGDSERNITLASISNKYFDKFESDNPETGYLRNTI